MEPEAVASADLPEGVTVLVCATRFSSDCRRSDLCSRDRLCRAWAGKCVTPEEYRDLRDAEESSSEP